MKSEKLLTDKEEKETFEKAEKIVKEEVKKFESLPLPKEADIFKYA